MKTLEAVIYVEPTPKGRPRFTTINGHASTYTPKKTARAEAVTIADIRRQVLAEGSFEEGVPLRFDVTFYRVRPKSTPKRVVYPVKRPDGNNYESLLFDALQHFVFPDDSQIVSCTWRKRFCQPRQPPRIELKISEEE